MSGAPPDRAGYGGQAVVEGVMIRGPHGVATAVRTPGGEIAVRGRRLERRAGRLRRAPLLRGVLVLRETIALGLAALAWSAAVAAGEDEGDGEGGGAGFLAGAMLALTLSAGVACFFVGPALAAAWLDRFVPSRLAIAAEGLLRAGLLVGYVWLIGRSRGVARVFRYHAAEHMAIAAFEHGRDLSVQAVRRFPKEHPRCGTSFLLTVAAVAAVAFVLVGDGPPWWRFGSRVLLIAPIAAVAYEAIRFAGGRLDRAPVRTLFAANIALQRLTTRPPDDEHIQVAIAALEAAAGERAAPDAPRTESSGR